MKKIEIGSRCQKTLLTIPLLTLGALMLTCPCAWGETPIIPGSAGFGMGTVAGSGRHLTPPSADIIRVTSLEDSGVGTLRSCVEIARPRTCIFEISGEIPLRSKLRIKEPYITIAGGSAPKGGITLTGGTIAIETHDVLLQNIAVRPGDGPLGVKPEERDGVSIGSNPPREVFKVVLDHVSLTWALDENLGIWYETTRDITVQNSIIAEGLDNSIHPKGPHSKGVLIGDGVKRVTLARNLISGNIERNPYLKPGSIAEVINNVVYGWGPKGGWSLCNVSDNTGSNAPVLLSLLGNTYKPGPTSARVPLLYGKPPAAGTRVYARGNLGPTRENLEEDEWKIASIPAVPHRVEAPPFTPSGAEALATNDALAYVLDHAGSRPKERASVDTRLVQEVRDGSGSIRDCVSGCEHSTGGWPTFTSERRPLTLPEKPFEDDDHDGYTNLEEWLHKMEAELDR